MGWFRRQKQARLPKALSLQRGQDGTLVVRLNGVLSRNDPIQPDTEGGRVMTDAIHGTMLRALVALVVALGVALPIATEAGPPSLSTNPGNHVIFPAKGQTAEQQKADELAAYEWATKQTGWDPYKAQEQLAAHGNAAQQVAESTKGSAVGSAARGALLGVAIGAIAGDAGEGAAIGAAAGGLTGGMRSNRTRKAAKGSTNNAQAVYKQQFDVWDKNYVAALEGKGYTVK